MRQVQLINVNTNEVTAFPILKSAAEYIESLKITTNSFKTVQTKLGKALNADEVLYETFKVIEVSTDQPIMVKDIEEENTEIQNDVLEDNNENETNNTTNELEEKNEDVEDNKNENKRKKGIKIEWHEDGELKQVFSSIQATARFMKEYVGRETMPYTPIHKSVREGIEWEDNGKVHSFRYEDKNDTRIKFKS